jgi:threonylcarbamoyladenosine tRNA methylthiotransferase MtaB
VAKAKKTVSFRTFGCKLNQYDTDFLKQAFEDSGYEIRDSGPSDIAVINTCAVTSRSAAKCRQAIRGAARAGAKVLVTGCYSQVAKEELIDIPGVIGITGVLDRQALVDIAEKALSTGDVIVDVRAHEKGTPFQDTPVREPSLTRAFLKIQEGCDDYCTYCIVPYARGPSRSRPLDAVLEEARYLVEKGYKEIVLTGTHIGLYGLDLGPGVSQKTDLPLVVRLLSEIQGLSRLRISSLEPHDVTPELIHCLRYPQVCHHLHLPLQSGSDRVLKKMGRRYDAKAFLDIVESVRKVAPDIGLSADIIVGFPGEDEEDLQHTLEIIRTAGISRLHVFKYSPRPGTPAYRFPGKVPEKEKENRSKAVISLGRELSLEFHRKLVGKTVEVLIEDDRTRDGLLQGVTRNYVRAWFEGPEELKGKIAEVRGREASDEGLFCEPIKL